MYMFQKLLVNWDVVFILLLRDHGLAGYRPFLSGVSSLLSKILLAASS